MRSVGETTEGTAEHEELKVLYIDDLIEVAENMVNYFKYHNKNTTKVQDDKIDDLAEILRLIK